ncbi:glutamine amidotransferase subunit [Malassezia pachydermatis]
MIPASLQSQYTPLARPPSAARPAHVLLACTGSVASIKVPLMVQALLKYAHVHVHVVATKASLHFFDKDSLSPAPYTTSDLAALNRAAGTPEEAALHAQVPRVCVWTDEEEWSSWTQVGDPVLHIELRRWADLVLIAPCSADTLAKICHGLCDNVLTSFLRALSPSTPTWLFPAMNTLMYLHPFTAPQLEQVQTQLGYQVYGPISKRLACGDLGTGAMCEWKDIVAMVVDHFGLQL